MTRRAIRGVLGTFLGTYTSRYSDYVGYWLFGFLIADIDELRIDLLATPTEEPDNPLRLATSSAASKFADQVQKAGLVLAQISGAWLTIRKLPEPMWGLVNGIPCIGNNLSFSGVAVMEGGRRYERELMIFVAPHNAKIERRNK